jgi:raffinose/stachyose/melibiose transport system permease protein
MTTKQKQHFLRGLLIGAVSLCAAAYIYPVFLMAINSLKPFGEVVSNVIALPKGWTPENYGVVIQKMNYPRLFFNTVIITVTGIAGIVFFSSLAAYIMRRRKNRFTAFARLFIITPMLIPFQTIMITLLKTMNVLHLSGSKIGLGVQYWGFGIAMASFIYYNFMATIPRELDESSYIDGAGTFRTFRVIIFPLLKTVTATVVVLDVMWIWNDFLLPLLMVNRSNETKTLVLAAYTFVGQFNTEWHYAMTAMVLTVLPSVIFFVLFQKNIIAGVVAGAVKG